MSRQPTIGNAAAEKRSEYPKNIILPMCDATGVIPTKEEHRRKYKELASRFIENMKKFADKTPEEVIAAGPKIE